MTETFQMGGPGPKEHRQHKRKEPGKNERLVLKVLKENDGPLSAYAILSLLKGEGIKAPLQVYRALRRLQTSGHVHRLESMNAFVLCTQSCAQTHHPTDTIFAICDQCGAVEEFHDDALFEALHRKARAHNFTVRTSMVEIHGLCSNCA